MENEEKIRRIYLDFQASTPTDTRVLSAMAPFWQKDFANALSTHSDGQRVEQFIEESRKSVAGILGARASEIQWTSGGSESNAWALKGLVEYIEEHNGSVSGLHVIVGGIEHSSVAGFLNYVKQKNLDATVVGVNTEGIIDLKELKNALRPETVLVSVVYVNNEIGTIQPIEKISEIIEEHRKGSNNFSLPNLDFKFPAFHSDASQACLYLDCDVNKLGVDLMTLDGHKMYGPKGVGVLYIRDGLLLTPISFSIETHENRRYGTPATPLIAGFRKAIEIANEEREEYSKKVTELRDYMIDTLLRTFPEIMLNGSRDERIAHNISISFPGQSHEFLAVLLDEKGISISTKSACRSLGDKSHVIKALGTNADSAIRISIGKETTKLEADYFIETLRKILKKS